MSSSNNRFIALQDEDEILVPATPSNEPTNPIDTTELVRQLLNTMRANSHSNLAVLTSLATAARQVSEDTGLSFPSLTPVIASNVAPSHRKKIRDILNEIWPPGPSRPIHSPPPLNSNAWNDRRSPTPSIAESDSDSNSDSEHAAATPTRRVRHPTHVTTQGPPLPRASTTLAPGVTVTTTGNLPVHYSVANIAHKRGITAANKAILEGIDHDTAQNIGRGVLERTIEDGIDSHVHFLGNQSRPPTPGEEYYLFPPSRHSEDFKPTPSLIHAPLPTSAQSDTLSQIDPITMFSSPPLGISNISHMESFDTSQGTSYNTVPDSQPESLLHFTPINEVSPVTQNPVLDPSQVQACDGRRQSPSSDNPMGLPASSAPTLEYIDTDSATPKLQAHVPTAQQLVPGGEQACGNDDQIPATTTNHHHQNNLTTEQTCATTTQIPVPDGEQAYGNGSQISVPFSQETGHPDTNGTSLQQKISSLCIGILSSLTMLSNMCINKDPASDSLNEYEDFVTSLLACLVSISSSTAILLESFLTRFHSANWYETVASFSLKPHHIQPTLTYKTHLNTLGGSFTRFINSIKEDRTAYTILYNTPAPDRSPLWYQRTEELDTHSHLSNFTITHIIYRILEISHDTASNVFDQVSHYCDERGIARNKTTDPDVAFLQHKCDTMEKILHKFCEPFESLPPNDLKIATEDMIELLRDRDSLAAYRDNPSLFTTGVVNTKIRFMHTALAPYMELRRVEHGLNPDIWKLNTDGTLANPLNNHPLLNSNFPREFLLPIIYQGQVAAPVSPTRASPTKHVPSENMRNTNAPADVLLSVPKTSSAKPEPVAEEILATTSKQGVASSMHAPGATGNASNKSSPPNTPTRDYTKEKMTPQLAVTILQSMIEARQSMIKSLEVRIGKSKHVQNGLSDDALEAMQEIETCTFDIGQLQDALALNTHEKRVEAIKLLLSEEHKNKLRGKSPVDPVPSHINTPHNTSTTNTQINPTPSPVASSSDAVTYPLGDPLSLDELNAPTPSFISQIHNKVIIDQTTQLYKHCITAYRRFHTATDCINSGNFKTFRLQQKSLKPLGLKVANINFALSDTIYKRIQSLQNFISSSNFNELPPLNQDYLLKLRVIEESSNDADTEILDCLSAHRELLEYIPKLNSTYIIIANKINNMNISDISASDVNTPSPQYSTDSNEFRSQKSRNTPRHSALKTPPLKKTAVELRPVTDTSNSDRYTICVNYGHAAPVNGTAPPAMQVQSDINAAIKKRNILGNTCVRASWSTSYSLYLDFTRRPGDLLHDAIHSTIFGYKRAGVKDHVIHIKDVSPTSIVKISNLLVRNADRSIMGSTHIWSALLQQNEYWNTISPADTTHPLSVQRLFRPDQSTTVATLKFHDTPDKQILNYLTARKWIFNNNSITLSAYHLDQPQPMCGRCQMWGHRTSACRAQNPRCSFCAGLHSSDTHIQHSHCCIGHDPSNGYECLHQRKCRNCNGQHVSSSTDCPYFEIRFDRAAIQQKYLDNRKNITVPLAPFQSNDARIEPRTPTPAPPTPPPVVSAPQIRTMNSRKNSKPTKSSPSPTPAAKAADS